MRAHTSAVIGPDGALADLHCEPPLTLRRTHAEHGECALCLVGTAAGPLAGDDLRLDLRLEPGARAWLGATGASVAQGRGGPPAALRTTARVGAGATLHADPGPLIVCAGSRIDAALHLDLAEDAAVTWRELVVLGRTGEAGPGAVTIRWDVLRSGRPVLRQLVDLTDPALRSWGGMTGGHRVFGTAFVTAPAVEARTVVHAPTAVAQRLDATTVLVTVLGDSAADVANRIEALIAQAAKRVSSRR